MKIAFLHPDLGIGGAERLVVDAALALKFESNEVCFFTAHHDKNHCFPETKDGSLDTVVVGDWLPRSVFGKCYALFAYLRMMYAAFYLIFRSNFEPDIVFCDQVSACIPILKLKGLKVIFYCHFPDQLLTNRKNWLKRLYRFPLDWFEERTTGMADKILVNSRFTAQVFRETFRSLKHKDLEVVYPTINVENLLRPLADAQSIIRTNASTIFLSLNRYERKKNISLAIEALVCLRKVLTPKEFAKIHLIIAGGYDERVAENKLHFEELNSLATERDLLQSISFLKSPTDEQKRTLFHCCTAVLYTPSNEHFGIVPLEAMLLGRPVIACNSGGPLETILDEETGYLCDATPNAFAEKMSLISKDKSLARELGTAASEHVRRKFSFQKFRNKLSVLVLLLTN